MVFFPELYDSYDESQENTPIPTEESSSSSNGWGWSSLNPMNAVYYAAEKVGDVVFGNPLAGGLEQAFDSSAPLSDATPNMGLVGDVGTISSAAVAGAGKLGLLAAKTTTIALAPVANKYLLQPGIQAAAKVASIPVVQSTAGVLAPTVYAAATSAPVCEAVKQVIKNCSSGNSDPNDTTTQEYIDTAIQTAHAISSNVVFPFIRAVEEHSAERQNITVQELRNNKAKEFAEELAPTKLFPEKQSLNQLINEIIDEAEQALPYGFNLINKPSRFCRDHIYLDNLKKKCKYLSDPRSMAQVGVVASNSIGNIINALTHVDASESEDDFLKALNITETAENYREKTNTRMLNNIQLLTINKPNGAFLSWNIFKVAIRIVKFVWHAIRSAILTAFLRVYVGSSHLPEKIIDGLTPEIQPTIFKYLKIEGDVEKYNKFKHLIGRYIMDEVLNELAQMTTAQAKAQKKEREIPYKYQTEAEATQALNESVQFIVKNLKEKADLTKSTSPAMALFSDAMAEISETYLVSKEGETSPLMEMYKTLTPSWVKWITA